MVCRTRPALAVVATLVLLSHASSHAAVPSGFQDTVFVSGLASPSVIAFAPDGRLFVGEKASGRVRVVKNGALLATPFLDLHDFIAAPASFDNYFERGLLGIAFDPDFASNQRLYVAYTVCLGGGSPCTTAKNRVARFRASGDVVDPPSHTVILDGIDSDAGNHNGGWLGFGPSDRRLYVSTGDGGSQSSKAQDLASLSGKILRIGADGSVPADNPFVGQSGRRPEIWASGLRNPWRCRFASDGRLFCADVGRSSWEEIDVVRRGANYGWPTTEGPFTASSFPQFTHPVSWYDHDDGSASVIGGDFGAATRFPGDHQQSYFFGDFAQGWIRRALLDASGTGVQSVQDFATDIGGDSVTDLLAGPDGALYYANYGAGSVRKIAAIAANASPVAVAAANPASGPAPLRVQFSSAGSSDRDGDPLSYGWSFGDGTTGSTSPNPAHTYDRAGTYTATLTVSDGKADPGPGRATVTIRVSGAPVVRIDEPVGGAQYRAGDTIRLTGSATDPEDGTLPASALHWRIILHHDTHTHPFIDDLVGSPQSFATATTGETSADVSYEVRLSATDSAGVTSSTSVTIVPRTVTLSLATQPAGLQILLDGQPTPTPSSVRAVVGFTRSLGVPSPQTVGGSAYRFSHWSDGGAQSHAIVTPGGDTTYTAHFVADEGEADLTRAGSIIARVRSPQGSGGRNLEIIRDGDRPPVGNGDAKRQYDTWDGNNTASEDWIGYAYPGSHVFSRVVFQEGRHFGDGGWFETLTVQVQRSGAWTAVSNLRVTPAYAGQSDGQSYQTYTLAFDPTEGDGIRLFGRPGGSADFISIAELEVYGGDETTPPPPPPPPPPDTDLTRDGTIIARVTSARGTGSRDLEVIRDGDRPPVGNGDAKRQYDTWDGDNTASEDWIGYTYASTEVFSGVVFQEGRHFGDGGWFETLTVQVRRQGAWTSVSNLRISPAYPGASDGQSFETYVLEFDSTSGDGIRIFGRPGGSADFVSVGELGIY